MEPKNPNLENLQEVFMNNNDADNSFNDHLEELNPWEASDDIDPWEVFDEPQ